MARGLNRNQIKYIAVAAMLLDHIAWFFVPEYSLAWELMHFVGRFTGPTMSIFLAEGYRKTNDINKYTLRLAVFALVSWPCFSLMANGRIIASFGMIYTLFLALLVLRVNDSSINPIAKTGCVIILLLLSVLGDWPLFAIVYALITDVFRNNKNARLIGYCVTAALVAFSTVSSMMSSGLEWYCGAYELGGFLVPIAFAFLYNGKKGSSGAFHKWFFYVFYPVHMLVLWFIIYRL